MGSDKIVGTIEMATKTARTEIESILGKDIGGYLNRLENEYSIIKKVKPILAKVGSRTIKYEIIDNFFNFWFRFIYKYKSIVEAESYDRLKSIIKRDFSTFKDKFLEKLFIEILIDLALLEYFFWMYSINSFSLLT